MFPKIDILKLQNFEEIENIYNSAKTELIKYNNMFFHYDHNKLQNILTAKTELTDADFTQFIYNWENFNNHKHILSHFFKSHQLIYPEIFLQSSRICIDEISISYIEILEEINVLKINKLPIPYIYTQLINKLVKNIVKNKILKSNENYIDLKIDIIKNTIELIFFNLDQQKEYTKNYKLNKFLLRYQRIYPNEYKTLKAWLIVSSNWKDIFLSSTFKQWTSCMNMINTYGDILVKYSNENYVRSRMFNELFNFKFR